MADQRPCHPAAAIAPSVPGTGIILLAENLLRPIRVNGSSDTAFLLSRFGIVGNLD
jgi:hypothetical protein